jgi:Ca2+-binding RTX toxin-like protein
MGWLVGALVTIGTGAQAACGTSHFKFDSSGIAHNWQDSQLAAPENDDNWYGEGGQDYLESQPCSDDLGVEGGGENDELRLGSGVDSGSGGAGRDDIFGGAGDDLLKGGNGDDELRDQENGDSDWLIGHDDNDVLDVADNDPDDIADGGPQTDTCGANVNDQKISCEN